MGQRSLLIKRFFLSIALNSNLENKTVFVSKALFLRNTEIVLLANFFLKFVYIFNKSYSIGISYKAVKTQCSCFCADSIMQRIGPFSLGENRALQWHVISKL